MHDDTFIQMSGTVQSGMSYVSMCFKELFNEYFGGHEMILVVGHKGEVGSAIFELCKKRLKCPVSGIDADGLQEFGRYELGCEHDKVDFMHVCLPWSKTFVDLVVEYARKHQPAAIIIHSTVPVGTTTAISNALADVDCGGVFHSPVRGTHPNMVRGLTSYVKFYAPASSVVGAHLEALGMKTYSCRSPEDTELLKLMSTTYYGVLIAWAGEVKTMCDKNRTSWDDWESWVRTTNDFVPRPLLQSPEGYIGGHCVIPHAEILDSQFSSAFAKEVLRWKESKGCNKEDAKW